MTINKAIDYKMALINSRENIHGWVDNCENYKSFPPWKIFHAWYSQMDDVAVCKGVGGALVSRSTHLAAYVYTHK